MSNRGVDGAADHLGREKELEARMGEVGREYAAAREHSDFNIAGGIARESCALIHDSPPAGQIVERVIAEAERLIGSRGGQIWKPIDMQSA